MSKSYSPLNIIESVEQEYYNQFKRLIEQRYNPNTKGHGLEEAVKDFLDIYLGSIFDFHTRVAVVDYRGIYEKVLNDEKLFYIVIDSFDIVPKQKSYKIENPFSMLGWINARKLHPLCKGIEI